MGGLAGGRQAHKEGGKHNVKTLLIGFCLILCTVALGDGYLALGTSFTFHGQRLPAYLSVGQRIGEVCDLPLYCNITWG